MDISEKPIENIKILLEDISVLLVTATDIETKELLNRLTPFSNADGIIQVFVGNQTYYVGILGIYGVVITQSEMGTLGRNSSMITTLRAIEFFKPKAVIIVGIAFGIDSKKQNVGDVIVSSHIIPYENSRIGKEKIYRSELPPASSLLINRVRQIRDWKFPISRSEFAKLYVGPLLSGEKLIDNLEFRNNLIRSFPNAIGGEMEGAGVYAASQEKGIDWLIIKSICDFADGEKGKNKLEYQALAVKSAVSFAERLLNIKFGFKELGFKPLHDSTEKEPKALKTNLLNELMSLFDTIEKQSEEKTSNTIKVVARQIIQSEIDNKYSEEVERLELLIPKEVLSTFEERIGRCWTMYNKVLATDDDYLPDDIDAASFALQKCICRELNRLLLVNCEIPNGLMLNYWIRYKCERIDKN